MIGYVAIVAIGIWVCIKTGSFFWVLAFLVILAIYTTILRMIGAYREYHGLE